MKRKIGKNQGSKEKGIAFIPIIIALGVIGGGLAIFGLIPAARDIATAIIAAIAVGVGEIGMALLRLAQGFLNWVISPEFLKISMTGPDNPVVTLGWGIMRDLANIILVIALIFIALGIILGIEEYQAKKTLPVLIIIALLINFTPVICGWIIDFFNTLMRWILGVGGIHPSFTEKVFAGYQGITAKDPLERLIASLTYVIFGFGGAIIYFLYGLIFIGRYIILWVLVIFSPIAFVSRVFFPSQRLQALFPSFLHWNEWWDEFIRWNIIGIFAGFFIFLANGLMENIIVDPGVQGAAPGAIGVIFIYSFPLLLLLIGLFQTMSVAQVLKGSLFVAGAIAGAGIAARSYKRLYGRLRKLPLVRTVGGRIRREIEGISEKWGATERMRIEAIERHRRAREKRIEETKKVLETMGIEKGEKWVRTGEEKIALFRLKTEKGRLEDKDLTKENIELLEKYDMMKDLEEAAKRRPDYAPQLQKEKYNIQVGINLMKGLPPEVAKEKAKASLIKNIIEKMTPLDFRRTVQAEALKNLDVYKAMTDSQMEEIRRRGSGAQRAAMKEVLEKHRDEIAEYIKEKEEKGESTSEEENKAGTGMSMFG